ncbi:MAG: retention module-containing protein, partial [Pseudomonas fluorescens]
MANEGKVIGTVSLIEGQAFARGTDGKQRPLHLGDQVFEGEIIVTGENGRVELSLDDGHKFLLRNHETVTLDAAVIGNDLPDAKDAALLGRVSEATDITRAIAEGSSLDQLLEETAAGLTGGDSGNNGHNFV